ncbi:MAG: hypothetical protein M3512_06600, partial [Bacteroidota bacterium]|nr:hypothetical protein [Bacteroidota bacterium]
TTRHIAVHIKISHGNLCYHYPKKEDIIVKLYEKLVAELDIAFEKLQQQDISIATIFTSTRTTFTLQLKYKFILMEMVGIMRNINYIKSHFQVLYVKRKKQLAYVLGLMAKNGLISEELFPGQHESLIRQYYIFGDFWISEAEILYDLSDIEKIDLFVKTANDMIVPYLSQKGINEWINLK